MNGKKGLVNLIKKVAQELEDAPGVTPKRAPAPPPPNLPPPPPPPIGTPAPADSVVPSEAKSVESMEPPASIVRMQTELKNLANTMTSQVDLKQLAGPQGAVGPDPTREQKQAYGRMSFADFITQHYTRDSDIPGVEFDWDPTKTDMKDKDPSKPIRTNVVMDTMQRIGQPESEFKIDGIWGPRTNASLRNAYAMAFGMLKMATDFKYQPRAYNQRNLQALKELIPHSANEISIQEKIERAGEISKHLQLIRALYREIETNIFNRKEFQPYIDGTQPYATYAPGKALDPRMIDELNQKFINMKVMGTVDGKNVAVPILVSDLVSTQALTDWQKKNMPSMSLVDILSQIKKHLDSTDPAKRTQ